MKKIIVSASVVVCLAGLGLAWNNVWGQGTATTKAADTTPHKVGLIDMAFLFSKYKKFETLRADLKNEIEGADGTLKAKVEKIKAVQEEMKNLVAGSPDFIAREKQITEMAAAIEADRKNMQRKFMREETKIYQQVYREVLDAVNKYAAIYKYTLIIRYSREEAAEGDDPQKVMQSLQRQVIFNRPEDDITDPVLRFLNKNYTPAGGGQANNDPVVPTKPARNTKTN